VPGVSAEQIKLAKEVDLLTYLQNNEPYELVKPKHGTDEYRTATHSSLVISKGLWFWNRGQVGGKTAVDYLMKIRGMGFVDAVETVLGTRGVVSDLNGRNSVDYGAVDSHGGRGSDGSSALPVEDSKPQPKKWDFYPPRPNRYSNKAIAYLQERGISPEIINRAMKEGILFESKYYNPESPYHNAAVCVFAGKNESGKIVFAALRGIDTDFKQDKPVATNPTTLPFRPKIQAADIWSYSKLRLIYSVTQHFNCEAAGVSTAIDYHSAVHRLWR